MELFVQYELKKNINYIEYLRMHSYWYKILLRNPNSIIEFKKDYDSFLKKEKINKIDEALKYIEMMENVFSSIK